VAGAQLEVLGAIGLVSLLLRAVICHSLVAPVPGPGVVLETALPGALDWFALGIALAVVAATWETSPDRFKHVRRLADNGGLAWLLAGAFFVAGAGAQEGDLFLPLYGVLTHLALGLASALLVLPAIAQDGRSGPVRILRARFVAWVGTVSYGIYLWHLPWLRVLTGTHLAAPNHSAPVGQAVVLYLATAAGAIALGAASWYLVERPAQRLAARLSRARRTSVAGTLGLTRT
jgi:peptidoglycan/LPS O-acetylase OafA/YrhL